MSHETIIPKKDIYFYNKDGSLYCYLARDKPFGIWIKREGKLWYRFRKIILERDKYTCKICGKTKKEAIMQVHHIIPVSKEKNLLFEENNCITLCKKCHSKQPKK